LQKLQEEDEEIDREQERKYQSTMQFIAGQSSTGKMSMNSSKMGMGMSGMGMSGLSNKGISNNFSFGPGRGHNGTMNEFGSNINMTMSGKAGGGSFNFGGMSTNSINNAMGTSPSFEYNQSFASNTYSKYSNYGTPKIGNYGLPHKRASNISASGFGGNFTPISKGNQTPNTLDHSKGLSGMGGSFGKFSKINPVLDSPRDDFIESQNSFSMAPNQKHDHL